MASLPSNLKHLLDSAVDRTPIIDHHAHPLLKPAHAAGLSLLSVASEANGDALESSKTSLAHIRATHQLAQMLGCTPTWDAVEAAIQEKRRSAPDEWNRRCLQGIETILVDDGLDGANRVENYSWHDAYTNSKCKRIVRIEALATEIIIRHCSKAPESRLSADILYDSIVEDFTSEIKEAIADPEVVGFKSIVCYRGGLDVCTQDELDAEAATAYLALVVRNHANGREAFARLEHTQLIHVLLHLTAGLIKDAASTHKKPIQFHTGLGDSDITLTKSSPSHLQTFITEYPTVPIVILHAGYPWTREAGYLATVYSNVYADIGEVFPCISRPGQETLLKEMLELCPWSKILWSTDGHWFPETYALAVTQIRDAFKAVLAELVQNRDVSLSQAVQLVQDVLYSNAKKLYDLDTQADLPEVPQAVLPIRPAAKTESAWSNEAAMNHLQALGCRWLRIIWVDYTTSVRCRVVPVKQACKVLSQGKPFTVSVPKVAFGVLQTDMPIPGVTAVGDFKVHPDWATLRVGPADGTVTCMGSFRDFDTGAASPLDPRVVLESTLQKAANNDGLSFLIGFEIEFMIMGRNTDSSSPDKFHTLPSDGHSWSQARVLADWGREGSFNTALDEIYDRLEAAGIDIEVVHPEAAPGQYELVLAAKAPLEACDELIQARQIIEGVASRRGFRMTLHPKPFANAIGTAAHMHMSVSSPGGDRPEVWGSFYAGILRHMRALIAFTYSSTASYERMVDSCWAGGRWVTWGTQNKEAPLRKCEGGHWELKVMDGLANPYFAVAAILAAGAEGIRTRQSLSPWGDCDQDPAILSPDERAALGISQLFPAGLREALEALREDETLRGLLHPDFIERYLTSKQSEADMLEGMTAEDRRRYLLERY